MLEKLEILNGLMDYPFSKYIYEYTITVESNINKLEISYEVEEGASTYFTDDYLEAGENILYLDVFKDNKEETYTLYVYKEVSENVSGIDNYKNTLEATKVEEVPILNVQILACSLFLLIIIIFTFLFKPKVK